MAKILIDDIRADLKKENWKLISTEYKNLDSELVYECPEGHSVYGAWKHFRNKKVCPICAKNTYKIERTDVIPKKNGVRRIIAFDQATRITGFAIYDDAKLIRYGTFTTQKEDEIARDHEIKQWVISLITSWKVDAVAIEGIQYQANQTMGVTTFETLARLQGILMETLYSYEIPYTVCHTATWRNHCQVKGKTRTDRKKSMQLLVKQWFDISVSDDCADAIGIGKYMSEKISYKPKNEDWT